MSLSMKKDLRMIKFWEKYKSSPLLLECGALLAGFVCGAKNAYWQVSLEPGLIYSGLMPCPTGIPFYFLHVKVFSLINYVTAQLLLLTGSEYFTCWALSGMLGAVAFMALASIIFSICRNVFYALAGMCVIYLCDLTGGGVVYSIVMMGSIHTYGVIGLTFTTLTIGLFSAGFYRSALICLGLAPTVHPSMGSFLYLIFFLTAIFNLRLSVDVAKKYCWYWVAGFAVSVAALFWQLYLMRVLPVISNSEKQIYLDAICGYWDLHRRKFNFFAPGVLWCAMTIVLSALALKIFKAEKRLKFMFSMLIICGALSLLGGVVSWLPQAMLPRYLVMFMPGRYIIVGNFMIPAIMIGIILCRELYEKGRQWLLLRLIVSFAAAFFSNSMLYKFGGFDDFSGTKMLIAVSIGLAAWTMLAGFSCLLKNKLPDILLAKLNRLNRPEYYIVCCLLLLAAVTAFRIIVMNPANASREWRNADKLEYIKYWGNDSFYKTVAERTGLLLNVHGNNYVSSLTRRPALIDATVVAGFAMAPECGPAVNRVMQEIYGVDLLTPPPEEYRNRDVPAELYRTLWEKRSAVEWSAIRKKFNVSDIIVPLDWKLNLPKVVANNQYRLYSIPEITSDRN